ncbi:type II toxin-antitoxin system PemK/MazF family toxin [Patescibacteria group bacterium]|nr:type II toxin-antitoxin system PemK/MazF family toxin [Patescibacteria group bacterium]
MKNPEQGDLFYLQWSPSVGHEFRNNRPGVVISSNKTIGKSNLISFMALTSNTNNKMADDILIKRSKSNNLQLDSVIKVQYISSFDYKRLLRYIGKVDGSDGEDIKRYLKKHFDLK